MTHGGGHELLMVAGTVLVVATGVAAVVIDRLVRRGVLGPDGRKLDLDELLIAPLVTMSLGAAAIHFSVIGSHFEEWWAFGLFFVATGWFQAFWAVAFAVRPRAWLARLSAAVNAAIVLVWVVSRTSGFPFGPDPGAPESIGAADAVATALELGLVVGGFVFGQPGSRLARRLRVGVASAALLFTVFAVAVALTTSIALASVVTGGHTH